jgi:Flp pilus assembly protein TadG
MKLPRHAAKQRRTAAHLVEFAFVCPVFFLFMFGIFEYSRYVMTQQIMVNAAREGARFAIVTTNNPGANPTQDVQNWVFNYMAGQNVQLNSPAGGAFDPLANVMVYTSDPANSGAVYLNGNTGGTLLCNANLPVDVNGNDVQWSSVTYDAKGNPVPWLVAPFTNAGYKQTISVVVCGTYTPILPTFLFMGNTIPISAQAIMYSEGN